MIPMPAEQDYIDHTIETVRVHRYSENSWPQWANIFADEIERLRAELQAAQERIKRAERGWYEAEQALADEQGEHEAAQERERGARNALQIIADDQAGGINVEIARAYLSLAAQRTEEPN